MLMMEGIGGMSVNAIDLLAIVVGIGIISFRLFVLPTENLPGEPSHAALAQLWRMLGIFLLLLTLSSLAWLGQRAMALSGRSLGALEDVLPVVLLQTHFGRIWLLRPAALILLWIGWHQTHAGFRPGMLTAMLIAAALVAATRSLSGHAADWGDITIPELADWVHLLAVSIWGGSLVGLMLTGFHLLKESANERQGKVVGIVARWSTFSGVALSVVVVTGLYNTRRQLGHIDALWTTLYGKVLLAKLILVFIIVVLGAANRYLGIPALRAWSPRSANDENPSGPAASVLRFLTLEWLFQSKQHPLRRFIHRAALEGALMIGVIICVAVLTNLIPARHNSDMSSGHHHSSDMAH